jgi:hypothetical protein
MGIDYIEKRMNGAVPEKPEELVCFAKAPDSSCDYPQTKDGETTRIYGHCKYVGSVSVCVSNSDTEQSNEPYKLETISIGGNTYSLNDKVVVEYYESKLFGTIRTDQLKEFSGSIYSITVYPGRTFHGVTDIMRNGVSLDVQLIFKGNDGESGAATYRQYIKTMRPQ